MKTLLGTRLCVEDRRHVLAAYGNRFTGEHKPAWALENWKYKMPYPLQFADDADWLAHTHFEVRQNGRLDMRHKHCWSSPTWPNNPELRRAA